MSALLFRMATDIETWSVWSAWFPLAVRPVFHDLWITLQHLREASMGLDPLGDPNSQFAYPRSVLLFRHFGLHHVPAEWLGALQAAFLTIGIVLVMRPLTARRAVATSLIFVSPPVMLAFERANLDCAIFLLCAVAAWQWSRSRQLRRLAVPLMALAVGAVLKLYPIFAMIGGAFAETGRRRMAWLGTIALVAAYWYFNRAELELVAAKVPLAVSAAWGCLVFFTRVDQYVAEHTDRFPWLVDVNWPPIALSTYAVLVVVAAIAGLRLAPRFTNIRVGGTEWTYYWVGALIYCGSFVGTNFAYRWVVIIMTLPLLLRCMRSREMAVAIWARAAVASVVLSLGAPLRSEGAIFVLIQGLNWSCALLLVLGCTAMRVTPKSRMLAPILRLLGLSTRDFAGKHSVRP